jgi:CheY-like chemotaxis protein
MGVIDRKESMIDVDERRGTLRILSLEDQGDTIAGTLDSLRIEGHDIVCEDDAESARERLEGEDFDVLILDQRLSGDYQGGARVITELKQGLLGRRNVDVYFMFVTASREWVDQEAMGRLRGFLGIEVKGSDLTRRILRCLDHARYGRRTDEDLDELRRVPLLVEDVLDDELSIVVPPWNPDQQLHLPLNQLPRQLRDRAASLKGRWLLARMNLYEPDPDRIRLSDFELTAPLEDDDGLA